MSIDISKKIEIDREAMGKRFKEALSILRYSDTEFARLTDVSPVRVGQYANGNAFPKADYALILLERFPEINWYYVILGEQYGSINSPMPFRKLKENQLPDETLTKEIEQLKRIIKLQEKNLEDKDKLIDAISKLAKLGQSE